MPYVLNVLYLVALVLLSPWLLYKSLTTGKYRHGLLHKLLGLTPTRTNAAPCVWFHGVSVGEIHLLRQVIAAFRRRHPECECVVSTTTDTGFDEARKHFPDLMVCWWPLDFSWAVQRALGRIRPDLVVLAEGEMWPNFLLYAKRQAVRVAVINARMSPRSSARYRILEPLVRRLFDCIDLVAVQNDPYAACFRELGMPAHRLRFTGSVKYDGVSTDRHNPRTTELGRLLAVHPDDLIWIAGSTQAPEESIAIDVFLRVKANQPNLRLFLVPRQKDRFEEVAGLLRRSGLPWIRRSELMAPVIDRHAVVLVDTIGELGALWGLADVAFVGGSLDGKRGGQNMIEPAAYGAAVVFGSHVWNFRLDAQRLVEAGAARQVADARELQTVVEQLLADPEERKRMGTAGRNLVLQQQGATRRTIDLLERLLPQPEAAKQAA